MIVIRATESEIDVTGNFSDLAEVYQTLVAISPGERCRFAATLSADPAPYDRLLATFECLATDGPVRISVVGDTLHATGSPDMLVGLASRFEFCDQHRPGCYCHFEWYEGNDFIAPDSLPLVVSYWPV